MAAVTCSDEFLADPRFETLALHLGMEPEVARMRMIQLWSWQTEHYTEDQPTYVVAVEVVIGVLKHLGAPAALVTAGLAEQRPEGLYIRGSVGRIEWLSGRRSNAQAERRAGGVKRAKGALRDAQGRLLPRSPAGQPAGQIGPGTSSSSQLAGPAAQLAGQNGPAESPAQPGNQGSGIRDQRSDQIPEGGFAPAPDQLETSPEPEVPPGSRETTTPKASQGKPPDRRRREPDPGQTLALALTPPEPKPGRAAEARAIEALWAEQERLRKAASPTVRGLTLTDSSRRAISALLRQGHTVEDLLACVRSYGAEAKTTGVVRYLDGVTNWRPDNVTRTLGRLGTTAAPAPTRPGAIPLQANGTPAGYRPIELDEEDHRRMAQRRREPISFAEVERRKAAELERASSSRSLALAGGAA